MINLTSTLSTNTTGINICVYGKSGVGKTSLVKTLEKPVIMNFEHGLLSVGDVDIPVFTPSGGSEIAEFISYCKQGKDLMFDTVFVDSITSYAELLVLNKKKEVKDARIAYMFAQDAVLDLVQNLVSIPHINTVFIAQEDRIVDDTQVIKGAAISGQKLSQKFPYMLDGVFHMKNELSRNDQGEVVSERYLVTAPTAKEDGKDRSGKLNAYEVPDLNYIFNKIKGSVEQGEQ